MKRVRRWNTWHMWLFFFLQVNPFNTKCKLFYLMTSSCCAPNTFHRGYKKQSVYAIKGKSHCLFWNKYKIHKFTLWIECIIFTFNLLVHQITSRLFRLRYRMFHAVWRFSLLYLSWNAGIAVFLNILMKLYVQIVLPASRSCLLGFDVRQFSKQAPLFLGNLFTR